MGVWPGRGRLLEDRRRLLSAIPSFLCANTPLTAPYVSSLGGGSSTPNASWKRFKAAIDA